MKESTSKEKVLKKVRNALMQDLPTSTADIDFDNTIYQQTEDPLEIQFVEELTKQEGCEFIFCDDIKDLTEKIRLLAEKIDISNIVCTDKKLSLMFGQNGLSTIDELSSEVEAHAFIMGCEYLIARTGSIMISSKQTDGRKAPLIAPVLIIVAELDQMVPDMKDALTKIKSKYTPLPSMITMITGNAKTMLPNYEVKNIGFGQKELYLFMLDSI